MSKEAMKLALEALEICSVRQEHQWQGLQKMQMAEHALQEALAEQPAQQEAKIVRWNCPCGNKYTFHGFTEAPPQRTWVGLTKSEITTSLPYSVTRDKGCFHAGALWAEAKLKDKNNA